jgi:proteasome alpha subunit
MAYNFYDWNNALQQRNEYVEDRLKDGSPVIAVSFDDGILMLTLRAAQRKVFEVYDRLMMGALGKQSDIESLRIAAIDTAHREGFERSSDDVTIQRIVGLALSPAIRRAYNDQSAIPLTLRAIFAELNATAENDHLFVVGYDGEFRSVSGVAVAAGTPYAEEQAEEALRDTSIVSRDDALKAALTAWGIGRSRLAPKRPSDNDEDSDGPTVSDDPAVAIREALKDGLTVEAGLLDRRTKREVKFRLLTEKDLSGVLAEYR